MNKRVSNKYLEPSLNKIEWNLLTSLSFNSLKRGFLSLCFVIFSLRDVLFWRNASGSVRLECLCEEHSDEKKIFEIRSQNQMIFSKNAVLPEKSKLLKKIRQFEQIKNFFFMDLRVRHWTYIQNKFPAQKSSRNLFKSS